jgi:hypothetical protein
MAHRHSPRRFIKNKRTGAISIRSTPGSSLLTKDGDSAFNVDEMLAALIEVEELLAPGFAKEQVPLTSPLLSLPMASIAA